MGIVQNLFPSVCEIFPSRLSRCFASGWYDKEASSWGLLCADFGEMGGYWTWVFNKYGIWCTGFVFVSYLKIMIYMSPLKGFGLDPKARIHVHRVHSNKSICSSEWKMSSLILGVAFWDCQSNHCDCIAIRNFCVSAFQSPTWSD